ncbi:hypothetical protein R1flu_019261 [Riccia fluitans]|uniref:DUF3444 domain-containing protein n=1 Tax=Riccia fluitans TaxID=41844 RepID=A0ABD1ZI55_9MARC
MFEQQTEERNLPVTELPRAPPSREVAVTRAHSESGDFLASKRNKPEALVENRGRGVLAAENGRNIGSQPIENEKVKSLASDEKYSRGMNYVEGLRVLLKAEVNDVNEVGNSARVQPRDLTDAAVDAVAKSGATDVLIKAENIGTIDGEADCTPDTHNQKIKAKQNTRRNRALRKKQSQAAKQNVLCAMPSAGPAASPSLTFWTSCPGCKMQYEYSRTYKNYQLQCSKCKKVFKGIELKVNPQGQNSRLNEKKKKSVGVSKTQPLLMKIQDSKCDRATEAWSALLGKTENQPLKMLSEGTTEAANPSIVPPGDQKIQSPTRDIPGPCPMSTFWTSCPRCKAEYQYLRGYVDYQLTCETCDELFKAREMKMDEHCHDNGVSQYENKSRNISKTELSTMTDEKPKIGSTKGSKKVQTCTVVRDKNRFLESSKNPSPRSPSTAVKAIREERAPLQSGDHKVLKSYMRIEVERVDVPSADFNDFDSTRSEADILAGQVWAVYDDQDGMPRYYARISKVCRSPFRVTLLWLDPTSATEKKRLASGVSCHIVSCGEFKTGRASVTDQVNMFSHVVLDKFDKSPVKIVPREGEVWAIYRDLDLGGPVRPKRTGKSKEVKRSYSVVEVLTDFTEQKGCRVVSLVKVRGFKSLFQRDQGSAAQKHFLPTDLPKFSHFVISKRMCRYDALDIPAGAVELDPAATPQELILDGDIDKIVHVL